MTIKHCLNVKVMFGNLKYFVLYNYVGFIKKIVIAIFAPKMWKGARTFDL